MSEQLLREMSVQLQSGYVFNSNANFCFHKHIYKSLMPLLIIQDSFFPNKSVCRDQKKALECIYITLMKTGIQKKKTTQQRNLCSFICPGS